MGPIVSRRRGRRFVVLLALARVALPLIFVTTIVLWVRSQFIRDTLIWSRAAGGSWIAGAAKGEVLFGHSLYPRMDPRSPISTGLSHYSEPVGGYRYSTLSPLDPCRSGDPSGSFPHGSPPPLFTWSDYVDLAPRHRTYFDRAGFAYQEGLTHEADERWLVRSTVVSSRVMLVPCLSIALVSGAAPALWAVRYFLRRRKYLGRGFAVSSESPPPDHELRGHDTGA